MLSDDGLVLPSNTTQSGLPESGVMKEDMISNALVWLSSRICNYIAAGEGFNPVPAGDRTETLREDEPGEFGKSQKSLLEKWNGLQHEISVWFDGLPATFKPSARTKSKLSRPFVAVQLFPPETGNNSPFDEIWYSGPMCGATMQHYRESYFSADITLSGALFPDWETCPWVFYSQYTGHQTFAV